MNIVLTGFMASGKSTVGKKIARMYGMDFIDTDAFIEKDQNMKISDIFAKFGEKYFRDMENRAAEKLSHQIDNTVIATGGGFVMNRENIEFLHRNGIIVNLNPSMEIIKARLKTGAAERPLAKDEKVLEELFEKRKPYYAECDIQIDINEEVPPEITAAEIMKRAGGIL